METSEKCKRWHERVFNLNKDLSQQHLDDIKLSLDIQVTTQTKLC